MIEKEEEEEAGDEISYRTRKMSIVDVDNRRISINECRKLSIVAQLSQNQRRQSIRRQSIAKRPSIALQPIPGVGRKQSIVGRRFKTIYQNNKITEVFLILHFFNFVYANL